MTDNPTVRRVHTARGSHIDPPLDQHWPDIDKLRWHLAVTLTDAGLAPDLLRITEGNLRIDGHPVPNVYNLSGPGWSNGAQDFRSMWDLINGIDLGIRVARKATP